MINIAFTISILKSNLELQKLTFLTSQYVHSEFETFLQGSAINNNWHDSYSQLVYIVHRHNLKTPRMMVPRLRKNDPPYLMNICAPTTVTFLSQCTNTPPAKAGNTHWGGGIRRGGTIKKMTSKPSILMGNCRFFIRAMGGGRGGRTDKRSDQQKGSPKNVILIIMGILGKNQGKRK